MATVDATKQKVQRILASAFNNVQLHKDGFALPHESTCTFVWIREWTPDQEGNPRTLVHVNAPIVSNARATPELYHWAATKGQDYVFGGVNVMDNDSGTDCNLMFGHTLLGDYLDPAELTTTVVAVSVIADQLDDDVRGRFGGERFSDWAA